jgi:hypothetical protein
MLCALTVRTLKPGTFEQFREAFMRWEPADDPPEGWVRFNMLRNTERRDEVICFGFFNGTVDELRRTSEAAGRAEQLQAVAAFVEAVGADGLYEIVEEFTTTPGAPA